MEKLTVNFEELNHAVVLTREQMKKVLGGDAPGGGDEDGGSLCMTNADCPSYAVNCYPFVAQGYCIPVNYDVWGRCRHAGCPS